jgi:hypothetical protein
MIWARSAARRSALEGASSRSTCVPVIKREQEDQIEKVEQVPLIDRNSTDEQVLGGVGMLPDDLLHAVAGPHPPMVQTPVVRRWRWLNSGVAGHRLPPGEIVRVDHGTSAASQLQRK